MEYNATDVIASKTHPYVKLINIINHRIYMDMIIGNQVAVEIDVSKDYTERCISSAIKVLTERGFNIVLKNLIGDEVDIKRVKIIEFFVEVKL